ncbi:hypothetical protein QBC41DRAFT_24383 [Cercophora samala]|uniref:Uncharacterized protein n=1 Tax=Cercophora samala TaxID=330535 RepID=A0AA40DG47_9PEZI|nr:hypothetical protein QBC41DRAFT_24383 [Cercophora samala]
MTDHQPGLHGIRHDHYHRDPSYTRTTPTRETPQLDGTSSFFAQQLVAAIHEHSDRPVKLILNFGHMQHAPEASGTSCNTIIYNAPGASINVRETSRQLKADPEPQPEPAEHPRFRSPSPVRAIIGGDEGEYHGRRCFRSSSPGAPDPPSPGIRYSPSHHPPSPSTMRHMSGVRRSHQPALYNRIPGTTVQDRLLHSHAHPHARWCRGCHHRHRKINADGYCPDCVYCLQADPLPHSCVEETGLRHVPLPEREEINGRMGRNDRMAEAARLRRAALKAAERKIPGGRILRTNPGRGRNHTDLMIVESDNTSDEYEIISARGWRFAENSWSEPDDWERL